MSRRPRPITIDGVEYPSLTIAAQALGVSTAAIWHRAHPEWKRERGKRERATRAGHRALTDPRPERQRLVRIAKEDAELARRLLLFFPHITTVEELFAYALHKLAEHTDD